MAFTTTVELSGADLANHLSTTLTDLEFELLVRARINAMFARVDEAHPNWSESHNSCRFLWSNSDKSKWYVGVGETYSKNASAEGEVLSSTGADAIEIMAQKDRNKLSLLLAPPAPVLEDAPF